MAGFAERVKADADAADIDAADADAADADADRDLADFDVTDFDVTDFDVAGFDVTDFDVAGFALLVGYNTFFCSSNADWPEFAEGGGTRISARLQKQKGTCDLNIVLN